MSIIHHSFHLSKSFFQNQIIEFKLFKLNLNHKRRHPQSQTFLRATNLLVAIQTLTVFYAKAPPSFVTAAWIYWSAAIFSKIFTNSMRRKNLKVLNLTRTKFSYPTQFTPQRKNLLINFNNFEFFNFYFFQKNYTTEGFTFIKKTITFTTLIQLQSYHHYVETPNSVRKIHW